MFPNLTPSKTAWRGDVQGLRALAVALVVIFHLNVTLLPGGYIGVDVFFVISGFLITAHLLREVERTGTVKLSQFWARRVRRLLPAAFTVLVVSAVAALLLMPRSLLIQNLTEMGQASLYVLNWGLAANSVDYLAGGNAPSIAQHYWSLSVEEQFYIVWPLLVILAALCAARLPRVSKRMALAGALGLVFVASLGYSIFETDRSQASAYFVTTTRAWEFAAGGLIAMVPLLSSARIKTHLILSWLGVAAIVGAAFAFNSQTAFPGWVALVPVAGTVLLLWAGDSASAWTPQYFAKAGPIKYLGDISYSVYLWHWPLIVLFVSTQGRPPGWKWISVIAVATVVLAALTYRFVEEPLRRGPGVLKRRVPTFTFMAAGMAGVCALTFLPSASIATDDARVRIETQALAVDATTCFGAYAILNDCATPYAVTDTVNASVAAGDMFGISGPAATDACKQVSANGRLNMTCDLAEAPDPTRNVVLIGDSHADQFAGTLSVVASENGWNLRSTTRSGCSGYSDDEDACTDWGEEQYAALIGDDGVDTVLVAVRSGLYDSPDARAKFHERLTALTAAGKDVVLIRSTPGLSTSGMSAATCVERAQMAKDPCAWQPESREDWAASAAINAGAHVVDTWDVLCDDAGCHTVIGGTIVYFDDNHLTTRFSRSLAPWLDRSLNDALL